MVWSYWERAVDEGGREEHQRQISKKMAWLITLVEQSVEDSHEIESQEQLSLFSSF